MAIFAPPALSSASTTYSIDNSVRFDGTDDYLSKTFGTPTNSKKWTLSLWAKVTSFADSGLGLISGSGGSASFNVTIDSSGDKKMGIYIAGSRYFTSNRVFRDPSAWYHIVLNVDTNNGTTANKLIVTINGEAEAASTYTGTAGLSFNENTAIGYIGKTTGWFADTRDYFKGNIANVHFIDGQVVAATDFGETNADGVWVPKAYSSSYGNNGFYLDFADGTSTTTLGYDAAGSNDWTLNGMTRSAGVSDCWLTDTPTNNFCVMSPIDKHATPALTNGALSITDSGAANYPVHGSFAFNIANDYYWEVTCTSGSAMHIGIAKEDNVGPGSSGLTKVYDYYGASGNKFTLGSASAYGNTFTTADVIGVRCSAGSVYFYKNGTIQNSGTAAFTGLSGYFKPVILGAGTYTADFNFGQGNIASAAYDSASGGYWKHAAPSGSKALCTSNLPTVTITQPASHFDVKTYTGNGTSQNITGLGFQPDFIWTKGRSTTVNHWLTDTNRGITNYNSSNTTDDESTSVSTAITSVNSDGWSLGANTGLNASSVTFVGWAWKETATAGFDVVTYTGDGSNRTISHNLGVVPSLIIVKARTTAGANTNWAVYHSSLANTEYLLLNATNAKATGATYWNSTTPTSSVFSLGTHADVNTNSDTYVAYLWAEVPGFSKFGTYTGNGSSDGPFVYCGFRPAYILYKSSSNGYDWFVFDVKRDTYNVVGQDLYANTSGAEASNPPRIDLLANGFKQRQSNLNSNGSGYTYIYAAFAEHPFGGSNVSRSPAR